MSSQLRIQASVVDVSDDHPAATAAVAELVEAIGETSDLDIDEAMVVPQDATDAEGDATKGIAETLIVTMGGPAGIASLAQLLRVWLSRDRDRTLSVVVREENGRERSLDIKLEAGSEQALVTALERGLRPDAVQDQAS